MLLMGAMLTDLVELTGLFFHNAAHPKYNAYSVQTRDGENGVLNERRLGKAIMA
jgi:hypothetical protein